MNKPEVRRLERPALWDYALRALGSRAHSVAELRRKLVRRAAVQGDVEGVLAQLVEYKYLDDRRFAEGFATARLENQRQGRARVLRDLRQRSVTPQLAERTVEKVFAEVDEPALIEEWVRRKYRLAEREGLFQEDKQLAAAYRRLINAGFRSANIIAVLKRFAKDPGLLDNFEPPDEALEEA